LVQDNPEYFIMHHDLLRNAEFWQFLLVIDQALAKSVREQGCPCGGRLHCADYLRNPRGGPDDLPKECCYRLSLCCDRDGCRKRVTPPSTRFLGRKVYLLSVIFLAAAMRQKPSPRSMRELFQLFGADRRTIARWQVFWREQFPQTRFWKVERAGFARPLDAATLPLALQEAFFVSKDLPGDWERLLRFLAPITIPGALAITLSG
jgi:hypothetical protein